MGGLQETQFVQWMRLRPSSLFHCTSDESEIPQFVSQGAAVMRSGGAGITLPPLESPAAMAARVAASSSSTGPATADCEEDVEALPPPPPTLRQWIECADPTAGSEASTAAEERPAVWGQSFGYPASP